VPWSKFFTFANPYPYPYQAALRISDVEVFPTGKGEFCAELMQINLHQLWMQRGRENLPHVVAGTVKPVRRAISFLTKEREMAYCGQEASHGSIIIQKTDFQHRRNGANRNWGSMSLTHNDFDAACKAITGQLPEAVVGGKPCDGCDGSARKSSRRTRCILRKER
jgi:hypothetical protein